MATLSKVFKAKEEIGLWIKENKPLLEDEIGIKFSLLEISENLLVGTSKDFPSNKIVIMPDFNFNEESMKAIEAVLENQPEDGKYIGVVILAESFPDNLWEYYKTLRNYVRLVLPLYLKADTDYKPIFRYPDFTSLTAINLL